MNTPSDALRFLYAVSGISWPDELDEAGHDVTKIIELLNQHDLSDDPGWLQSAREHQAWIGHVLVSLDDLTPEQATAPLCMILGMLSAYAIEIGKLGVLAEHALERDEPAEADRELLRRLIREMTAGGPELFSRICEALDVLVTATDGKER